MDMIDAAPESGNAPAGSEGADVMIRLTGEISTKARRTRSRFQRILARNLADACRSEGIACTVRDRWSRIYLHAPGLRTAVLRRVFGISSFSAVDAVCDARLEQIVTTGSRAYRDEVRGKRYAVRARRSGSHPFSSHDVMAALGAELNAEAEVDLTRPDVEIWVEIRGDRASFHLGKVQGAGGLPLGAEGRAVALISGGFDSAVAAWMMLRRGVELDYVFCNLGGEAYKRMVAEVGKILADRWSYGTRPVLHVLDFEPVVTDLKRAVRPLFHQIVLKRQMYRAANLVGAEIGAEAVITGESVGQVSSQTLANLRAIDRGSELPVLRPLVGMDKEDIISRARQIGTYSLSARVREYCALGTGRPATAAATETVVAEDARLDLSALRAVAEARERMDLRGLALPDLAGEAVFTSRIPPHAVVVDIREHRAFQRWHWPGAIHRDAEELARECLSLDPAVPYVLYCAQGLHSARIAERMQAAGYEAYSLLGGETAVRRLAESGTWSQEEQDRR